MCLVTDGDLYVSALWVQSIGLLLRVKLEGINTYFSEKVLDSNRLNGLVIPDTHTACIHR